MFLENGGTTQMDGQFFQVSIFHDGHEIPGYVLICFLPVAANIHFRNCNFLFTKRD